MMVKLSVQEKIVFTYVKHACICNKRQGKIVQ